MSCKIAIPKFKEGLVRIYMQSKFTASLRRSGAEAVWIQTDDPEKAVAEACKCDGLLLRGGEDVDPAFYGQTV
jgi:putative glutamine amidotransferase